MKTFLVMAPVIAESEVTLSELEKDKGYIICIDDEASVIYTLKEQLSESFGSTYEILGCESGEEALELIETLENEEKIIEMVITDQIMPGIKGDELLKIIHQRLPDTIKVMLTGHAGLQSAIKAVNEGGISRFFEKPWDIEIISKDLRDLLNQFKDNRDSQALIRSLEKRVADCESRADLSS